VRAAAREASLLPVHARSRGAGDRLPEEVPADRRAVLANSGPIGRPVSRMPWRGPSTPTACR
jgi:hypothetical protein